MKLFSKILPLPFKTKVKEFDDILKHSKSGLNILIKRREGLGDVLMTIPILIGMKKKYENMGFKVSIDFCTNPLFKNLCGAYVNTITTKTKNYQLEIDLQGKVDFLPICNKNHRQDLLACLCQTSFDKNFRLNVEEKEIEAARSFLKRKGIDFNRPVIAVAPLSNGMTRKWPNFPELPQILPDFQLLLIHDQKIELPGFININVSICSVEVKQKM